MSNNDEYSALVEQTVQAHIEMTGQVPSLTEHLEIQMAVSSELNEDS